jgi:PAS domain S-box-containing protein
VTALPSEPNNPLPDPPDKASNLVIDTHLHFAALINSSHEPIISKDLTGRILSWNRAAVRVFGYEEEEILGQSILRLVPPDFHHEENELQRKLKADEPIDPYETTWLRKDGGNEVTRAASGWRPLSTPLMTRSLAKI